MTCPGRAGIKAGSPRLPARFAWLPSDGHEYAVAPWRQKFRLASENPIKDEVVGQLLDRYADSRVLMIGQYLHQLRRLARTYDIPLITGQTPQTDRERLYDDFRHGRLQRLILSKVGNFALDLPDANGLIQVYGTIGSRQEEAQRLGRILRPKGDGAVDHFYTLVTRDTKELDFSLHRQLFLTEQGYSYEIPDESDLMASARPSASWCKRNRMSD